MAYKGYQAAMHLKRLINVEFKHTDFNYPSTEVTSAGTLHFINDSGQGTTDVTHIGDSILNKTTSIRGTLQRGSVNANVRVIVFKDKTNTLVPSDLLTTINSVFAPFSQRDADQRSRYTLIQDKTYFLDIYRPTCTFEYDFSNNDHTKFDHSSNAITSNAYKILFISDVPTGVNTPEVLYTRRHTYVDN